MKVELNTEGTDVVIEWNQGIGTEKEKLYLSTSIAKYDFDGEFVDSCSFYMSIPISTAEKLMAQLTEIIGKK